jgi:hypothetical protein
VNHTVAFGDGLESSVEGSEKIVEHSLASGVIKFEWISNALGAPKAGRVSLINLATTLLNHSKKFNRKSMSNCLHSSIQATKCVE